VLAAGAAGWVSRYAARRRWNGGRGTGLIYACAGLAGIAVIYASGVAWLGTWLSLHGTGASLAYELGVKPFILVDLAKAAAAVSLACIIPRRWYGQVL
jgi:biotin transporter BioY